MKCIGKKKELLKNGMTPGMCKIELRMEPLSCLIIKYLVEYLYPFIVRKMPLHWLNNRPLDLALMTITY